MQICFCRQQMWRFAITWLVSTTPLVRGAVELWVPRAVSEATWDHVHGALHGLDMRCIANTPLLAGCLMKDLYFDRETNRFLFFGRTMHEADKSQRLADAEVGRRFNEHMCVSS